MSYIQQAFELVCKERKEAKSAYVCLIETQRCYGGPEEGGWWYNHNELVEFQEFATKDAADAIADKVKTLAVDLNEEARRSHGEAMLASMEWLDARGLDADFLPEPDGECKYVVWVCDEVPMFNNDRPHYE